MNIERFRAIVDRIKADPSCWDQTRSHCGSAHCLAGHAQIDAGYEPDRETVQSDACFWLDISMADANYFFSAERTLADFERAIDFDDDGYASDGFGKDGPRR